MATNMELSSKDQCGQKRRKITPKANISDQTTKIQGMFVHPGQVAQVVKRHPEVLRARLVVARDGEADTMTLRCEVAESGDALAGDALAGDALAGAIAKSLQAICKLKGKVALEDPGTLPNDGKVIDDTRDYG